jgi:UDP-N-acetylglucosamine 2-epimerase (non-hydrolysing)
VRILLVIGTRPEAIKMAPVYHALKKHDSFTVALCNTGQHRELSKDSLRFFAIEPDFDLDIMKPDQNLNGLLSTVISRMHEVIEEFRPTHVMVQGDTSTVLGSAMAAFQNKVKVVHLEAGLRSGDMQSPFPEEMNRVLTSCISTIHFAPTPRAVTNLKLEGIENGVHLVGNTVIDALLWAKKRIEKEPEVLSDFVNKLSFELPLKRALLLTSHRRENFGEPLKEILTAIEKFAIQFGQVPILFPVHPNPNVKEAVHSALGHLSNVHLLPPLDYPDLVMIMSECFVVVTDSGGIQEEAPTFGKPVLVLRENTERPEGVEQMNALLVGSNADLILSELTAIYTNEQYYKSFSINPNPYGDGTSAEQITRILLG